MEFLMIKMWVLSYLFISCFKMNLIALYRTLVLFWCVVLFAFCDDFSHKRVRRIVGGGPALLPPRDDPLVYLRFARRAAVIRGVQDFPHYVFRGIRYGHKPTGKDRFQRPRQYFLQNEYNATLFPPPCVQQIPGDRKIIGSEDCLFLNVFTPDLPDGTEGFPVIVWIHGGGFRYGSASQYGGRNLVQQRVVLVTVQYRLGTLGFLSTRTPQLPGNAALWDLALGVQWVRNHIGFFGGNPHRIVVMGQGTGASSALMIALSNIAKGSVSAVVAMSGTAVAHWSTDNTPAVTSREIAEYHGCPTSTVLTMLKCLQNIPAENIVEGDGYLEQTRSINRGFISGLSGQQSSSPNVEWPSDGRSLPSAIEREPIADLEVGNIPEIPLLTGITKDETKKAVLGNYKSEIITKLKSVPNFLDQVLVKNLQQFIGSGAKNESSSNGGLTSKLSNTLDPLQFGTYLQVPKNNIQEGLGKIAEATADALFNLPAFLTANSWSKKGAPTYLYSFEHFGKAQKGFTFLKGSSLVGNGTSDSNDVSISHGDDLSYIFEARNIDGSPLENDSESLMTEEDKQVRETYTKMIVEFAKTGKITINGKPVENFSGASNNYVQIAVKPKEKKNFRFCQIGLWAGLVDRLQSSTCQFLNVVTGQLKNVENLFYDTVSIGNESMSNMGGGLVNKLGNPLGGLFGSSRKNRQGGGGGTSGAGMSNMVPPIGFL